MSVGRLTVTQFPIYKALLPEQFSHLKIDPDKLNMIKDIIKTHKIVDLKSNYIDLHAKTLKNSNHQILENIWQSCKVYKKTFPCTHKTNGTLIWKYHEENHLNDDNEITDNYFQWKNKLINNKFPIEYPMGISNKNKYEFILHNKIIYNGTSGHHEAFKDIYLKNYLLLVKEKVRFQELKNDYLKGRNILIVCDHLPYYPVIFKPESIFYSSGYCLGLALCDSASL